MESIETGGGAFSSRVDEIKKDILDRTIKKINGILKKTDEIHKMNVEFYGPMENMGCQKTTAEQEQKSKKIGTFLRGVEKRRGEILKEREKLFVFECEKKKEFQTQVVYDTPEDDIKKIDENKIK